MARRKASDSPDRAPLPAIDPSDREEQMIALAQQLAERQLLDGTASSQVITHYLRLATDKTKIENDKLRREIDLMEAKIKALESEANRDDRYAKAIEAMRSYAGFDEDEDL